MKEEDIVGFRLIGSILLFLGGWIVFGYWGHQVYQDGILGAGVWFAVYGLIILAVTLNGRRSDG